jgi:hypothetical protein
LQTANGNLQAQVAALQQALDDCESGYTGIVSVQANAPFRVFPNPARNELNVELERATNGTLALFDMKGRVVETLHATSLRNTATINISHLAAGTYILRLVENGTASAGAKVVKE